MKKLYAVALLCIATFAFTSCGGKKGTGMSASHVKIPKDASAVMSADLKLLQAKTSSLKDALNGETFKKLELPAVAIDALKQVIDAVDTDQKLYFFTKIADQGAYMAISFVLKDSDKLKKAFDKAPIKPEFKKEGDIELTMLASGALGFKGKTALILINESPKNLVPKQDRFGGYEETEDEPSFDDAEDQEDKASRDRLRRDAKRKRDQERRKEEEANRYKPMSESEFKATFVKVFKTTEAESLKEAGFVASEAAGYDVSFWYDGQAIQKLTMTRETEQMFQMFPFMKEMSNIKSTSYMGVKFEKGEVILETAANIDTETGKKYLDIISQASADKIGRTIPISKPTGLISYSLNVNAIYNLIKDDKKALEGVEMSGRELNLKPKEIFDAFDGNLVLAVGDIDYSKLSGNTPPKSFDIVLAVGLNKKDAFKKVMKKLVSEGNLMDKGKGVYAVKIPGNDGPSIFLVEKNDAFYITASSKLKDDLVNGKGGMDVSQVKGNAVAMYSDLKKIISQLPAEFKKDKVGKEIMEQLKDFVVTATPIKNGKMVGKFVLRFNDTSKNSLKIISELIQKGVDAQKSRELSLR